MNECTDGYCELRAKIASEKLIFNNIHINCHSQFVNVIVDYKGFDECLSMVLLVYNKITIDQS